MKTALTTLGLFGSLALSSAQTISNPSFESNSFTLSPGYISSNTTIVGWTSGNNARRRKTSIGSQIAIPVKRRGVAATLSQRSQLRHHLGMIATAGHELHAHSVHLPKNRIPEFHQG